MTSETIMTKMQNLMFWSLDIGIYPSTLLRVVSLSNHL